MLLTTWGWWYAESAIPWAAESLVEKLGIETFREFHTSQHTGVFARWKIVHSSTSLHIDWVPITQGVDGRWYQLWVMWHHMSHWGRDRTVGEVQMWSEISWKSKNNGKWSKWLQFSYYEKHRHIQYTKTFPGHKQKINYNSTLYSKNSSHVQKIR